MPVFVEGITSKRVYNVHAYQPNTPTNGTTDAQPFIQAVINTAIASNVPFSIELDAHTYLLNNELNFHAATKSFEFYGLGPVRTVLKVGANFGSGKALLRIDMNTAGDLNVSSVTLRDFDIAGQGENNATDPIGIFFPSPWRGKIWRVNCSGLGNTVAYIPNAFNADISYCSWTASGRQTLERMVTTTVRVNVTAGSNLVTATETGTFFNTDAGRIIYITDAAGSDYTLTAFVSAYNSSTQITLDRPVLSTRTNTCFSFDVIRGYITAGSKTLTVNNSTGFVAADVGRFIYIVGAGEHAEALATKVTAVSGATITVLDAAITTVPSSAPKDVWLGPTVVAAYQQSVVDTGEGVHTNDLTMNSMQLEQYHGPAVLLSHSLGVYMHQMKCEGEPESAQNNFATSRQALVQSDGSRTYAQGLMLVHTWVGPNTGLIAQLSTDNDSLKIDDLLISGVAIGTHLVEQTHSGHMLVVGDILSTHDWTAASLSTLAGHETVLVTGTIISTGDDYELSPRAAGTPYFSGSFRSTLPATLNDGEVYSFLPMATSGIIEFWSGTSTIRGRYYFRVTSSPFMTSIDTPGSAMVSGTGTLNGTGAAGKFTVTASSNGRIYMENEVGSGQSVMWHVLA